MRALKMGFQVEIVTWENDGDFYKTKIYDGLSKADAEFYIDMARPFSDEGRHGNAEHDEETIEALISEVLVKHKDTMSPDIYECFSEGDPVDLMTEMLGYPESYSWGFCRKVELVLVYDIPIAVKFKQDELTTYFSG